MEFSAFYERCQNEGTVSDFESYLSYCIFERKTGPRSSCTLEEYSRIRDHAFDRRDENAARKLYELAGAVNWKDGEWEGSLR